jgi:outer membrane protein assembly factor BamD (BamD/ComL family)
LKGFPLRRIHSRFSGKTTAFTLVLISIFLGCSKSKPSAKADETPIRELRGILAKGDYDGALKKAKEISNQVPPGVSVEEALYLQGYVLAYGKSEFQKARLPLKQLLDLYPSGSYAPEAQKLLADCQYWQGQYDKGAKEYKKLGSVYGEKGYAGYAQLQLGNCLLLDDKIEDALSVYRELVEKRPTDPSADSAQLMVANAYLKLQNPKQAKTELRKLMSFTQNKDIQRAAQKALRQIEEEEPFRKGVGVPE